MRVIAICGPNHGGTTLLGAMLGSSKNWADSPHIGEAYSYFTTGSDHYGKPHDCVYCDESCRMWAKVDPSAKKPHRHMAEVFGSSVLVDSSKITRWLEINDRKIDVSYVYIWKDIRSLHASFMSRKKRRNWDEAQVEKLFARELSNNLIRTLGILSDKPQGFVALSLESLLLEPGSILKKLCDALDMEYFEGKENFWNFEHHQFHGARSVSRIQMGKDKSEFRPPRAVSESYQDIENLVRNAARIYI